MVFRKQMIVNSLSAGFRNKASSTGEIANENLHKARASTPLQ